MLLLLDAEIIKTWDFHEQILPTLKSFWDFSKISFTFNILIAFWASQMWKCGACEMKAIQSVTICFVCPAMSSKANYITSRFSPCQFYLLLGTILIDLIFGNKRELSRLRPVCLQSSNMSFSSMWLFRGEWSIFYHVKLFQSSRGVNMHWNMVNQTMDIKFVSKKKLHVNKLILIGLQVQFYAEQDILYCSRAVMYLTKNVVLAKCFNSKEIRSWKFLCKLSRTIE